MSYDINKASNYIKNILADILLEMSPNNKFLFILNHNKFMMSLIGIGIIFLALSPIVAATDPSAAPVDTKPLRCWAGYFGREAYMLGLRTGGDPRGFRGRGFRGQNFRGRGLSPGGTGGGPRGPRPRFWFFKGKFFDTKIFYTKNF